MFRKNSCQYLKFFFTVVEASPLKSPCLESRFDERMFFLDCIIEVSAMSVVRILSDRAQPLKCH